MQIQPLHDFIAWTAHNHAQYVFIVRHESREPDANNVLVCKLTPLVQPSSIIQKDVAQALSNVIVVGSLGGWVEFRNERRLGESIFEFVVKSEMQSQIIRLFVELWTRMLQKQGSFSGE